MSVPDALAEAIDRGDLGAVEECWLARLSDAPVDLCFFDQVARALVAHEQEEPARFLLGILDEQLREAARWEERLGLLQRAGDLVAAPGTLHGEILRTLEARHGERPSFRDLCAHVGLHRAVDDIPKNWEKVKRLEDLLAFDVGTIVAMEGKGPGRVEETNLRLGSFKVVLADGATVRVGFAAARKLLRPLPPGHFQRRKLEELETLRAMAASEPDQLVRLFLESEEEPQTANAIRQAVTGLIPAGRWPSFWNRVRKNPQLVALPGGRQLYRWAGSEGDAVEAVRSEFSGGDLTHRLELLRIHGDRDRGLRDWMTAELEATARQAATARPSEAFAIGAALEAAAVETAAAPWSPAALLAGAASPEALVAGLDDRNLREVAYRLLPDVRDDWPETFHQRILRGEDDPRLLEQLAARLAEAAPAVWEEAVAGLLQRPHACPAAFTWLAERAAEDEALRQRNPLRMVQQILEGLADPPFQPYRRRLAKLAEAGSTVPRLLSLLDASQAPAAERALERASGLEGYARELLRNGLHLRFPELREAGEAPLYALPASIAAKREELQHLIEVEVPANRKAIQEARELGDLRENFEYKSARQRHEYLSARVVALQKDLARARPIVPPRDGSAVRIGSRVELAGPGGQRLAYAILGPWESDPAGGVLSNESDRGELLLGKVVGDQVAIEGETWSVTGIVPCG